MLKKKIINPLNNIRNRRLIVVDRGGCYGMSHPEVQIKSRSSGRGHGPGDGEYTINGIRILLRKSK